MITHMHRFLTIDHQSLIIHRNCQTQIIRLPLSIIIIYHVYVASVIMDSLRIISISRALAVHKLFRQTDDYVNSHSSHINTL